MYLEFTRLTSLWAAQLEHCPGSCDPAVLSGAMVTLLHLLARKSLQVGLRLLCIMRVLFGWVVYIFNFGVVVRLAADYVISEAQC